MTRSALRRFFTPALRAAVRQWDETGLIPKALRRKGFKRLPGAQCGIERTVLIGPTVVIKTTGFSDARCTGPRYRKSRTLAPSILVCHQVIAQPRGRVLRYAGEGKELGARERYLRNRELVQRLYGFNDDHEKNYALFPDGTVRCIDY